MRLGRRIAFDFGSARIGVAVSSVDGIFASPLEVVPNTEEPFERIVKIIEETAPLEIYVGLPLNLQGEYTGSTTAAVAFARALSASIEYPLRLIDERLSTRAAQSQIQSSGKNTKQSRSFIDAAAATLILEGALEFERSTGRIPGKDLSEIDV